MIRGKSVRIGMVADGFEPDRLLLPYHRAEHPEPIWQRADPGHCLGGQSFMDELNQHTVIPDHTQSCVRGTSGQPCFGDKPSQQLLEISSFHDRGGRVDQGGKSAAELRLGHSPTIPVRLPSDRCPSSRPGRCPSSESCWSTITEWSAPRSQGWSTPRATCKLPGRPAPPGRD